ncbi:MAG: hypothetical protein NTY38_25655, partial [Acidobacteria bacterium]|nr:hypothetical protein [Acidobacteriota bacterium]
SPSMAPARLRAFLKDARAAGILVHALDGYPEAVLPSNHADVLSTVRKIIDFNASSRPEERFHGIHLDNEPYLLLGHDSSFKASILSSYVELNSKIHSLLRETRSTLVYGVDVPFWFSDDLIARLLPLVDNIGIMDYRNKAEGSDGLIEHARTWIAAANRAGKRVYIGVETASSPASQTVFLHGIPESRWQSLTPRDFPLLEARRFQGFSLHSHSNEVWRFVGLGKPDIPADLPRFREALTKLQSLLGVSTEDCQTALERERPIFVRGEYRGYEPFALSATPGACPQAFESTSPALPKITFFGLSHQDLERELALTAKAFAAEPSFHGFAIHHFTTYQQLPAVTPSK